MRTRQLTLGFLVLLGMVSGRGTDQVWADPDRRERILLDCDDRTRFRVAVAPFAYAGRAGGTHFGEQLAERLAYALRRVHRVLDPILPDRTEHTARRLDIFLERDLTPREARHLRVALRADTLLTGRISYTATEVRVEMVSLRTGRVLTTAQTWGYGYNELLLRVGELAEKLADRFPLAGRITNVEWNRRRFRINLGRRHGLREGAEVKILRSVFYEDYEAPRFISDREVGWGQVHYLHSTSARVILLELRPGEELERDLRVEVVPEPERPDFYYYFRPWAVPPFVPYYPWPQIHISLTLNRPLGATYRLGEPFLLTYMVSETCRVEIWDCLPDGRQVLLRRNDCACAGRRYFLRGYITPPCGREEILLKAWGPRGYTERRVHFYVRP